MKRLSLEYAQVILTAAATAVPINGTFLVKIEKTFYLHNIILLDKH